MKAIFISDAHIKRASDEGSRQLMNFLTDIQEGKARILALPDAEAGVNVALTDLFIAGDLFDYWLCAKDNINPEFRQIINKLIELQKAGIRIHLCEGNHDFFLTEYFGEVLGMEVYEEAADVMIENMKTFVSHGDTLDKGNRLYLLLRKILHSRVLYNIQRIIPARIRWAIAALTSRTSKEMNGDKGEIVAEKMMSYAVEKFQAGYDVIIVGHCHVPLLRHYEFDGRRKTFVALGDWIRHFSFLYYENRKFTLAYYRSR